MTPIVVLGAGSFAIEVLEAIELGGLFEPLGFVVSRPDQVVHARLCGLPVVPVADLAWPTEVRIIAGIVSTRREDLVVEMEARGFTAASVTHPRAIVSPRAEIHPGCFIGAGAIIGSHTRLDPHVILNRGANIGHDVHVSPFVTVGPGATMAGGTTIGAGTYVGVGAVIRDHVAIGRGSVVGAGAVVVKPVGDAQLVAGCPAAVMRTNIERF